MTRNNMAGVLSSQGEHNEALKIYQEVFDVQQRREVLGPDHPDTLMTRHNMAGVFFEQGKYSEALRIYQAVFEKRREVLGPNHPDTLRTRNSMAAVREIIEDQSECSIQFCQEQQKAYFHLSGFISNNLQNASIKPVRQGLYLPSFEARNVKINGKCTAITRGLSQALLSQGGESFLSNLKTSAEIYERIAQGKQVSKREEREVFAFSKLLNKFEGQLDSSTNSLPLNLIHTQSYKTLGDLSNYIARVKGNFAIHLVISNHVVAIYRIGNNYTYFDSNAAFVSGLKSVDQLMQVVEKGVKSAGYKAGEKGFLVEHFDVDKANSQLSNEDKQILAKEIKTERQLLAEQDKEFGFIKVNGQELSRVQLYDFGTKIHVEGGVPVLINANMNLSSKKFQDHLDKKEVSMTAREYLGHLKNSKNVEEVIQATKVIPFEGSSSEIRDAEKTRKTCNNPELYLSDITISNQLMKTKAPGN